ncbi:zinc-dependent alcohol dehydrogenase [Bifidobacterium thermophilum]|uniref:zinc-dependent alcohol dehydrogenase n=1 Tax=Bifidobacterium thermophilum TaxID=33905 RepID=UPI0030AB92DF
MNITNISGHDGMTGSGTPQTSPELPATMRSAVYLGKEHVEVRDVPIPSVGDDDILVRNICSGVCGTDVAVYSHGPGTGHKVDVGGEFGHETVSRVVAVGRNVTDFQVGERVYPYPLLAKGDPHRAGTLGGFSQYMLCPKPVRGVSLYPVDPAISDRAASLIEPFTVGMRAAKHAHQREGEHIMVFGAGTIGIAAALGSLQLGAGKVMICDYSRLRLEKAVALGLQVCDLNQDDPIDAARAYFGDARSLDGPTADIDCMIDAAGAESVFETFMAHGKIYGRFVVVAVNNAMRQLDLLRLTFANQTLSGSGGYMPEDVADVQRLMACGRWDIGSIITASYDLEHIEDALRAAGDTARNLTVVIDMEA